MIIDRITLNFGESEMELAKAIRQLAEVNGNNRLIKRAIREYLERQSASQK